MTWFRRRRKELGLRLEEVAVGLGVSVTTVGNWERGHHIPEMSRVADLAAVLQATVEQVTSEIARIAVSRKGAA